MIGRIETPSRSGCSLLAVATVSALGAGFLAHHDDAFAQAASRLFPELLLWIHVPPLGEPSRALASLSAAALTLFATAILLALGRPREPEIESSPAAPAAGPAAPLDARTFVLCSIAAAFAFGFIALLFGPARERPAVLAVWLAVQFFALVSAWSCDRRFGPLPRPGLGRGELVFLCLLTVSTLVLVSHDLNSWVYSFIGDEWAVYERAEQVSHRLAPADVFGPVVSGVYAAHPPFLSFVQALGMRIFGTTNFGWRFSGALTLALTLPAFHLVARRFFGLFESCTATLLLSVSMFLAADAHTGYGWGFARWATWAAFAGFVVMERSPGFAAAAVLGILCGYASLNGATAVLVPPLILLIGLPAALSDRPRRSVRWFLVRPTRTRAIALLSVSLALFALTSEVPRFAFRLQGGPFQVPGFIWKTNLGPLWKHFFGDLGLGGPGLSVTVVYTPAEFAVSTAGNVLRTALAPVSFRGDSHFIAGPAVDPVTGALALFGMTWGLAIAPRNTRALSLWLTFLPFAVAVGVLNPTFVTGDLRITRLHYLVPFWILFAALGLESLRRAWARAGTAARRAFTAAALALLAFAVTWNLQAILVKMPKNGGATIPGAVLRVLQESPRQKQVFVCLENWGPIEFLKLYPDAVRLHFLKTGEFAVRAAQMDFTPGDRLLFTGPPNGCAGRLFEWFRGLAPGLVFRTLQDEPDGPRVVSCDVPSTLAGRPRAPAAGSVTAAARISVRSLAWFTDPCTNDVGTFGVTRGGKAVRRDGRFEEDAWAQGPETTLLVAIPPAFGSFESRLLLVDSRSTGTVAFFRVELDGRLAVDEMRVTGGETPRLVIPLGGARILALKSRFFGDPAGAVPVWMDPVLVRAPAADARAKMETPSPRAR